MKKSTLLFCIATALSCFVVASTSNAQSAPTVTPKTTEAAAPILIASNGQEQASKLLSFDVANADSLERLVVTLSDPKLLLGLQVKLGDVLVGDYKFNGIFNVDANEPTMPTQIPVVLDAQRVREALQSSTELSVWGTPSQFAAPDAKLKVGVRSFIFNGQKQKLDFEPIEYRFGVLVRNSGWDGVAHYRIPGMVCTPKGTLIAVYDARRKHIGDLPADVDVACSRSFDQGKTWESMQIAIDLKGEDETKEGVGDPAILVDPQSGRIWIAALWAHNGKSLRASEPGLKLGTSGQLVLAYSDDDGATWSEPRNITSEVAPDKDWRILFQGPGSGIVTRDGKLVFPAQFLDKDGAFFSTIVWSDDKGQTWHVGTGAKRSTCEAQVVELNDGTLMLNMRNYNTDVFARSVATTDDLGATWKEHPTSGKALPCPICQASLIRFKSKVDGDDSDLLAFMNPDSVKGRVDMTVKLSEDEGQTWSRALTLYRPGSCGYSSIAKLDAETLGVLYETNGGLIYQTVKIQDVRAK